MKTPIVDFIANYINDKSVRMHMPGHKGVGNIEKYDITEISGADSLYEANGIIKESEENASLLFGADTFYSAEGSSLSIRAMLYLTLLYAKERGCEPLILAARNVHKTFVSAISLLGIETKWLVPQKNASYLSCPITAEDVEKAVIDCKRVPTAIYITSPDYLGNTLDVSAISRVCKKYGILLLVDNAHGAYLKFIGENLHPIDLGADMCCDSAHKTLPALTGAAYLHISKTAPDIFKINAKNALSLFGSTSPSYLILSSLDRINGYLSSGYREKFKDFSALVSSAKEKLKKSGYTLTGNEPLKITIVAKKYGYKGTEIAKILEQIGINAEFSDPDFIVFMLTPENDPGDIERTVDALLAIQKKAAIDEKAPEFSLSRSAMSPKDAILSPNETLPASKCMGRVLAAVTVGCPPAVPILISGEIIDEDAIKTFEYYGIGTLTVVKEI